METDEKAVPVPHLVVVSGWDEVGILDVSVCGANGLWGKAVEVGGEIAEQRTGVGLVGRRLGGREINEEQKDCDQGNGSA